VFAEPIPMRVRLFARLIEPFSASRVRKFWLRYWERQGLSGDGLSRLREALAGSQETSSRAAQVPTMPRAGAPA
jgi:hypothetical protein